MPPASKDAAFIGLGHSGTSSVRDARRSRSPLAAGVPKHRARPTAEPPASRNAVVSAPLRLDIRSLQFYESFRPFSRPMSQSATSVATDHHISKHDFGPSEPMVAMLHLAAPSRRSESSRGDLCCELGGRNVRGSNVARLPITCKPAPLSQRRLRARRPRRAFFFTEPD